jgi:hypothetical protein
MVTSGIVKVCKSFILAFGEVAVYLPGHSYGLPLQKQKQTINDFLPPYEARKPTLPESYFKFHPGYISK